MAQVIIELEEYNRLLKVEENSIEMIRTVAHDFTVILDTIRADDETHKKVIECLSSIGGLSFAPIVGLPYVLPVIDKNINP